MEPSNSPVGIRPSRDVRLVEQGGMVRAFPEPHRTPVLPAGWAPLSREQQDAVVEACEAAPGAMIMRLGSLWEPGAEYRVYRLANELWGGLSVITKALAGLDTGARHRPAANVQLLGLARETPRAASIALDFFNWDLEAQGQDWRLEVTHLEER
jgi:hypothetical protein